MSVEASGVPAAAADNAESPAVPVGAPRCDNCGASVPGRYCGVCGQRLEPPVHSLGHFARIATEDLTHADSRLWRTLLALLVKPGMLTREFLAGRRARYLPPVRLYLVVSLVFFLWAAMHSANDKKSIIMVKPEDAPPAAAAAPPPATTVSGATAAAPPSRHMTVKSGANSDDCADIDQVGSDRPWAQRFRHLIRGGCEKALKDGGRSLSEGFMHNLPRAMFVFLPLLAAVMMLFYWRPRRYYVEHLLFLLHNHVFVFVSVMILWALLALIPPAAPFISTAWLLYTIWYVYRAMRVVYGQGRALTAAKLVAMSFVYLIFGVLMLSITAVYSVLTA